MKCPKCGYTSFDFLDTCKKCGQNLEEHKTRFGLRSVIFPQVAAAEAVEEATATAESAATDTADFGFDFMSDQEPEAAGGEDAAHEVEPAPGPDEAGADFDFGSETEEQTAPAADDLTAETGTGIDSEETFDFGAEEEETISFDDEPAGDLDFSASDESAIDFGEDEEQELGFDSQPDDAAADEDFDFSLDETEAEEDADDKETPDPFEQRGSAEVGRAPEADTLPLIDEFDRELPDEEKQLPVADDQDEDGDSIRFPGTVDETGAEPEPVPVGAADRVTDHEDLPQPEREPVPPAVAPRLAAATVDLAILAALLFLFLIAGQWMAPGPTPSLLPTRNELLDLAIPYFIVFFALCFGYFTLFHFLTGQTPGKMLFQLQVEAEDGSPLTLSQAFLRSVGGLVCLLTMGLGFLAILVRPSRRGWNDDLAGSRLVGCREGSSSSG